jgi:D-arginine dehydrogenase
MESFDVVVIGGGIAGVSLGYELSEGRSVCLLEMENTLAFHTTGRSAATFLESYGGPAIRALTLASRDFLESAELFAAPVMSPLPLLYLGPRGRSAAIEQLYAQVSPLVSSVTLLDGTEAEHLHPAIAPGYTELAMLEPGAMELDVHGIHQGYTQGLRRRGGTLRTGARVVSAQRIGSAWQITDSAGNQYTAAAVVNAAGAWCDEIASVFGVTPVGIQPLLRTIFMIGAGDVPTAGLPLVSDIDDTFYFKPEGHQFLCSPADETPHPPGNAKPDEIQIARALDAINTATTLNARHVRTSWGGLRNFVPDRVPVVGYAQDIEGFFWYAGQGGYGIQIAAALARTGAALFAGHDVPADVATKGLTAGDVSPGRPGMSTPAEH